MLTTLIEHSKEVYCYLIIASYVPYIPILSPIKETITIGIKK